MDWLQVLVLLGGNLTMILPLWLWNRAESRADMRHMDNKLETFRTESLGLIRAIHDEMKDFHGRLCEIEAERNRK